MNILVFLRFGYVETGSAGILAFSFPKSYRTLNDAFKKFGKICAKYNLNPNKNEEQQLIKIVTSLFGSDNQDDLIGDLFEAGFDFWNWNHLLNGNDIIFVNSIGPEIITWAYLKGLDNCDKDHLNHGKFAWESHIKNNSSFPLY